MENNQLRLTKGWKTIQLKERIGIEAQK